MLGALWAAIMAASFFLPWVEFLGEGMGPTSMFGENGLPFSDFPWQAWAFVASFALAGIAFVMSITGRAAGVVMLVAGAIPYGIIAHAALDAKGLVDDTGVPLPSGGSPMDAYNMISDYIAVGMPAYFISAGLLVFIGLARAVRGR